MGDWDPKAGPLPPGQWAFHIIRIPALLWEETRIVSEMCVQRAIAIMQEEQEVWEGLQDPAQFISTEGVSSLNHLKREVELSTRG